MAERAAVLEHLQLGVESTGAPGTVVSANKNMLGWDVDFSPIFPTSLVHAEGQKFATGLIAGKEYAEGTLKCPLGYVDLAYLLASAIGAPTITTPAQNGTFTVTLGSPSAGNFTLTFNGQTTGNIVYTAANSVVQTALAGLSSIGAGNVTVTGGAGGPYTVTFAGALQYTTLALTGSGAGLTGGTFGITSTAASLARLWVFKPTQNDVDTLQTYTLEKGSSVDAARVAYAIFTELGLSITNKAVQMTGKFIGQKIADAISLTGGASDVTLSPVATGEVSVWAGSSILGMTRLTRALETKWDLKGRSVPVLTLDDSVSGYSATAEGMPEMTASIVVAHDTVADGFMTDMRARTAKYLRIRAVGAAIESGYSNMIQITMPFRFQQPKRGVNSDLYTSTFDLAGQYDTGLGAALEVRMITSLTAL